ncbi:MAG TPA: hypothetical protein VFM63_02250 [Pyrinomonadaceae bacterium]|nr:hypothetical protein [Pyrinomonadaceae bacterium]
MSKFVKQLMAAVVMATLVSTGAFAQGRGQDKRPDKKPIKVIDGKGGGGGGRPSNPPPQKPKEDRGGKKKP